MTWWPVRGGRRPEVGERLTDSAKRCVGCGERLDATHRPDCQRGQGRVNAGQDETGSRRNG